MESWIFYAINILFNLKNIIYFLYMFNIEIIKSEDKENCEEENFDLNFTPPNEDIEIKDNNMNFKLSQFSGSSTNYNVNDVLVEIVKLN